MGHHLRWRALVIAVGAAGLLIGAGMIFHRLSDASGGPNALRLLREEALRVGRPPPQEDWSQFGTNALPVLRRALERGDSPWARRLRELRNGLAQRLKWDGWRAPTPASWRAAAARVVAQMGPDGAAALPSLVKAMELETPDATIALMKLGPRAQPAQSALIQRVRAEPQDVDALRALLQIGASAEIWTEIFDNPSSSPYGRLIAETGRRIALGQTNEAILALVGSGPPQIAEWSLFAGWSLLRDFGVRAAPAAPLLGQKLGDAHPGVRQFAAETLGLVGPESGLYSVAPLVAALAVETNAYARAAMIVALGRIGVAATNALPQLERLRQGDDEDQIRLAREAVESIERESKTANSGESRGAVNPERQPH